jgi:hypothetical protein
VEAAETIRLMDWPHAECFAERPDIPLLGSRLSDRVDGWRRWMRGAKLPRWRGRPSRRHENARGRDGPSGSSYPCAHEQRSRNVCSSAVFVRLRAAGRRDARDGQGLPCCPPVERLSHAGLAGVLPSSHEHLVSAEDKLNIAMARGLLHPVSATLRAKISQFRIFAVSWPSASRAQPLRHRTREERKDYGNAGPGTWLVSRSGR